MAPRRLLLLGAVGLPVIYYGVQLAAAPFFPGYSFVRDVASLLGSEGSPSAPLFNAGAIASGISAMVGAAGIFLALRGGAAMWLRILVTLAVLLMGIGNVWAGVYALPDPRHGANPFMAAFLGMPIILCLAAWLAPALRGLRLYLTVNLLLLAVLAPVMAGGTGIDRAAYGGLLQRLIALVVIVPLGVVGWYLLRRPRA